MGRDIEISSSQFRQEATGLFTQMFEGFRHHVKNIDRQLDENVFQQQLGLCVNELKRKLHQIAEKVINQHSNSSKHLLSYELTQQIEYYISEFRQKVNSM